MFGANGFLNFLPAPELSDAGGALLGALGATGYMFPLIKSTELAVGILLLSNRLVPFALTLIAPVLVTIVAFHAVLSPAGAGAGVMLTALTIGLAYTYRAAYAPLFVRSQVNEEAAELRSAHA